MATLAVVTNTAMVSEPSADSPPVVAKYFSILLGGYYTILLYSLKKCKMMKVSKEESKVTMIEIR